jgi:lipid II:glycine glycyltransferase (peptidoglycan interpeptide bridge formation enzyme)
MEENKWKELWEKCSGSIYQSWEWAEINKKKGREPVFLTHEENGELKAGILCFSQEIKTPIGVKNVLFSEGTPLSLDAEDLIEVLKKYREESKKYFYGIINPTFFNYNPESFAKMGFQRVDNSTISINLSPTLEDLFDKLEKKSARWGVKKAEKEGVKIEQGYLKNDLRDFYDLYEKTSEEQFSPEPWAFFEHLNMLERAKLANLLIAKHKGKVIGGALILLDKNYGVVSLSSISEEGMKLQAMNLLYWEMIKYCKENRKRLIDLGGYMEGAKPGSKMYNINQFKENFGGEIMKQPAFSTSRKYTFLFKLIKRFGFLKRLYKKEK